MSKQKKPWFEEYHHRIDPGLRYQLQRMGATVANLNSKMLPVIIRLKNRVAEKQKESLKQITNRSQLSEIQLIGSFYGTLTPQMIRILVERQEVERIYYDREVQAFLDIAAKSTGARDVQLEEGLTGKGVTIAILDTGVYPHDDLTKPHSRIRGFADFVAGKKNPYDDQGHGTHCAGDAAGNGFQSEGLYAGAAPGADIVGVKVLDFSGGGRLSTVIRGIEWCIENKEKYGIRVLSLSLGSPALESYRDDPLAQAAEKAWHKGIVVCAAAGNDGPHRGTISTPGNHPLIITVGAADDRNTVSRDDDVKAPFSSMGPTLDGLVKPDIYAPGTDIISLNSPGSELEKMLSESRVGEYYIRMSGTSMATPFCAGVAALLLEANPYLSPNDIKSIFMSTASILGNEQAGYLDVKKAVQLAKQYLENRKELTKA